MGEDNAPSFREANPCLALPAASEPALDSAFESYGDAGKIFAKGDDLKPRNRSCQIGGGTPFAKGLNFADAIQRLGGAKARHVG